MSSPPSSPQHVDRFDWRTHLTFADPQRIRALVEGCGVFSTDEAIVAEALALSTLDCSETYHFLLAETDGHLVGYTCFDRIPLTATSFDLYWIVVSPERRGSGLATELIRRTVAQVRAMGGTQVFAETSSRPPYAAARAFYQKAAFAEAARFENFYGPQDAKLVYRRML